MTHELDMCQTSSSLRSSDDQKHIEYTATAAADVYRGGSHSDEQTHPLIHPLQPSVTLLSKCEQVGEL